MSEKHLIRKTVPALLLALIASYGPARCESPASDPAEVVRQAKAAARTIPAQAQALTELAWPLQGRPDPQVAALARSELVDFGEHGIPALRSAISRVSPVYTADVVTTMIQARRRVMGGRPAAYIPGLEDTLWVGSADARRLVIPELSQRRYPPVLMACVDSAIQFPGLRETVIRNLGEFRDHRARFYLEEILLQGPAEFRSLAADSLARIGGLAMVPLHRAALSERPEIRHPAIAALAPKAGIQELTTLYEYMTRFPDDDESLLQEVRSRAMLLESVLEQQMDFDSASPSPLE